ncbi:sugar phosphate isomerase/epimerase family protein [Methylobacterium nodulans]|uniref:Xylose isomerase domain protein TIM barrel n=1 Tax=Methylobacterium nodulans (strain LMG 21967 / CNCM I-2342 / ORS 2060) TaxID=460265 RepID=B8IW61_METNO|nr:sugar phosphate isomerase/epimerase family protein [Methylobacterium nodulans]ACL62651.1 Xylose isomerase domain protein TIM barrel [Methylobacterium nodulans ORS 2060]
MAGAIGINTYSYIWTVPAAESVRRLADLGYRTFELVIHPGHLPLDGFSTADRRHLVAVLDEVGATDCALNLPSLDHNLASSTPRVRAASVQMFRDAIDLASDLGIGWLVTVPGRMSPLFPPGISERTAWMRESIEALLPHAEARGVGLAVENIPIAAFPDAASLGDFVRSFASPKVAACYDAANAHFIGEDPVAGMHSLSDCLRILHLSDTGRTVWRHDPVGTGTVPFAEVARAVTSINFTGPCMLEIIDPEPEAAILRSHDILAALGCEAWQKEAQA